jgi:hypothetical protein
MLMSVWRRSLPANVGTPNEQLYTEGAIKQCPKSDPEPGGSEVPNTVTIRYVVVNDRSFCCGVLDRSRFTIRSGSMEPYAIFADNNIIGIDFQVSGRLSRRCS